MKLKVAVFIIAVAFVFGACKDTGAGDPEKTLVGIEITKQPEQKQYSLNEDINLAGIEVTARYSDGSTAAVEVTIDNISGYDKTRTGSQTVTVTWQEKTTTFSVYVSNPGLATVEMPRASPPAGAVNIGTLVTLSTTTEGADIYYTTDNSMPTTDSTRYTPGATIPVNAAMTIKAIAVKSGMNSSLVLEAVYTIARVARPAASPSAGVVIIGTLVTLSSTTDGASIYYTADGSAPAAGGTQYTGPIAIAETVTIKAIAVKSNMIDSEVLEANYTAYDPSSPSDAVVSFKVNAAGTGFENTGTGGAAYTATAVGGSFETIGSVKVFNTGGELKGTTSTSSWGATWPDYKNIGYVDLNGATGDLIGGLTNYTVETYLYLPADAQTDRIGQHIWNFSDKESPDNALWLNYRTFQFMTKKAGLDTFVDGETYLGGWANVDAKRTKEVWHHVVLVKNGASAVVYMDKEVVASGTVTNNTYTNGTFVYNHLAKPCYPEGVYDQTLFKTKFHSFNIYKKAHTAEEVALLYNEGPIGRGDFGSVSIIDSPAPTFGSNVTVHDPSIFRVNDTSTTDKFRIIGSFLASAKTGNLISWTQEQNGGGDSTYSTMKYFPKDNTANSSVQTVAQQRTDVLKGKVDDFNYYASDIHKMPNGKFYHYYSMTSSWKCSAIGLAISDTADGNYITQGLFVRSAEAGDNKSPDGTKTWAANAYPNCIDPQAFFDKDSNNFYMVYGSWSGGIFIYELDTVTGKPKTGSAMNAENGGYGRKLIANSHTGIEAPYILYSPDTDYYYLFVSFGGLAANGGYNMRIFRSRYPYGPYEDATHPITSSDPNPLTKSNLTSSGTYNFVNYGVKIQGGYQFAQLDGEKAVNTNIGVNGFLSPGHNSAYYDPDTKKYFLIHHTRFVGRGETHQVRVREMFVNEDNWLVAAPFRYDAGTVRTFVTSQLAGTWKILSHLRDNNTDVSGDHTSKSYTFNMDGTISGSGAGTWERGVDGKTARITLGGKLYKGVFLRCWDEYHSMWVNAFTAMSSDGLVIWGASKAE